MAFYLYQAAYTTEAWAAQLENPQDVRERTKPMFDALGGKIVGMWYAFGEWDIVVIIECPDNVSYAAAAIAVAAGGPVKAARTTVLMSIEEGLAATAKAKGVGYQPPSS